MAAGEALYVRWMTDDNRHRNYLLSCDHGQTELTLEAGQDTDAVVLANMVATHRTKLSQAQTPILCLCVPMGWQVQ